MRLFQVASAALAAFTLVRALALFLESYSAERAEHSGDEELARLCSEGQAPTSLRMRATCLDLIRARATPLFLKAALRAAHVGYEEFAASLLSPRSVVAVGLFLLMGVATPLLRVVRFAFPNNREVAEMIGIDEEAERGSQRILYLGDTGAPKLRGWAKMRHRLTVGPRQILKQTNPPACVEDITDGSATGWNESSIWGAHRKLD